MNTENQNGTMTIVEQQSNAPAIVKNEDVSIGMPSSTFGTKNSFEHSQRVAIMLSQSELIPATFQKKPANVMIALELASRVGASPFMVMQNLYVVHGKPAWSSQFLIATLNASGRFTSLRYEEDDKNGGRTRAIAKDIRSAEMCYGAWVSMEMAKAEGWVEKNGSKWKTMPEVMRRYRAASFFTKQFAPEVSMGIHTYDEAQDIGAVASMNNDVTEPIIEEAPVGNHKRDRIEKLILNAKTMNDLAKHKISAEEFELTQVYADKLAELTPKSE
jgi:hypothetical protein